MAGTFEASTINVISPNGLVTKAITASNSGYLTVPSPQFSDAINLTSGQIKFPATQVPSSDANTLDDYEEGTWMPTLSATGVNPTISGYLTRSGYYIKIGNIVHISANIRVNITNAGSGIPYVNLPFVAKNDLSGVYLGLWDVFSTKTSSYTQSGFIAGSAVQFDGAVYNTGGVNLYLVFNASYAIA